MTQDDVDYMFKFAGYGNPESRVWFVGIEEGGQNYSPARLAHQDVVSLGVHYQPLLPETENPNGSSVWKICSEIASECGIGSMYFRSNMGAIPRRSEREAICGFDRHEYIRRVVAERIPMLRSMSEIFKPAAVVFHGKGAWTRYQVEKIFGLKSPDGNCSPRVVAHLSQRILLTNFFSRRYGHFTAEDQRMVVTYINALLEAPIGDLRLEISAGALISHLHK